MADQTTSSIVVDATPSQVMAVIADFPAYPEWAKGVKTAEVRSTYDGEQGDRAREVFFALDVSPVKDEYTLAYVWDGDREVTWTLVEGKMLRALDGAYVLRDLGGSTEVTYRLALDVSIPMIGMIKRKGEKILIDTALKGLKQRVEQLG
ncbi:MAG: cyclase [Nocardioides sp.]|nr:cyclase [Nocardioides sp.]